MTYEELSTKSMKEELLFYQDFWKQYIELEKLFLETEKYVSISEKNKNAYSIQYNIILQAICAEVDIVIKRLCYEYDNHTIVRNMNDYINVIISNDPNFKNVEVNLELYDMKIYPWKDIGFRNDNGCEKPNCPYWWNGYISIKHKRLTFSKVNNEYRIISKNIDQANQKNVLGALAGLFVLEVTCLQRMRQRFADEFKKIGYPTASVQISNKFNDSIFQKNIDCVEFM